MTKHISDWLSDYRKRLDKRRDLFYQQRHMPKITVDASRKYDTNGRVKPYDGWSIVYFLDPKSHVYTSLERVTSQFHHSLEASGIVSKFAFLPANTFHVTLVGIATEQNEQVSREIVSRVSGCFYDFKKQNIAPPRVRVRGDISPDGSTIIAPIEPVDKESLDTMYYLRGEIRKKLHPLGIGVVRNTPMNFHGHISLAYIINSFTPEEYKKFTALFKTYLHQQPIGELLIENISLHHFTSMIDWGNPVDSLSFNI